MTNKKDGVLYVGVTNDLRRRVQEHKSGTIAGFTKRYNLDKLAYYEEFTGIDDAIRREKRVKDWKRAWKVEMIEKVNPEWEDLMESRFN